MGSTLDELFCGLYTTLLCFICEFSQVHIRTHHDVAWWLLPPTNSPSNIQIMASFQYILAWIDIRYAGYNPNGEQNLYRACLSNMCNIVERMQTIQ